MIISWLLYLSWVALTGDGKATSEGASWQEHQLCLHQTPNKWKEKFTHTHTHIYRKGATCSHTHPQDRSHSSLKHIKTSGPTALSLRPWRKQIMWAVLIIWSQVALQLKWGDLWVPDQSEGLQSSVLTLIKNLNWVWTTEASQADATGLDGGRKWNCCSLFHVCFAFLRRMWRGRPEKEEPGWETLPVFQSDTPGHSCGHICHVTTTLTFNYIHKGRHGWEFREGGCINTNSMSTPEFFEFY